MKRTVRVKKRADPLARSLRSPLFRQRVVKDAKQYTRKGRSSSRHQESKYDGGSIELAKWFASSQSNRERDMRSILNLTQHTATPEQVAAGVHEPRDKGRVQELLTFEELPGVLEVEDRVCELVAVAQSHDHPQVMIGGAPYLMGPLEKALYTAGFYPMYSFTKRDSVEVPQPDGSTLKTQVFRHVGWVGTVLMSEC